MPGRVKATPPPLVLVALGALGYVEGQDPPTEWRIFAYGQNTSDKGNFVFDEVAADAVMAAFAKKGSALTMDYEHQALAASSNGQPAPNSCYSWEPAIRLNDAGKPELWATNAKWTERAAGMIRSKEYLYFSPAFETEKKTGRVLRIVNMALTNIPALDKLEPLVAATQTHHHDGEDDMKTCKVCGAAINDGDEIMHAGHASMAKLTALVGLTAAAGETEITGVVSELATFRSQVVELTGAKNPVEALGLVAALKSQREEITALKGQIEGEKVKALNVAFDAVLDEAAKAGKLPPSPEAREKFVKPLLALSGGKVTQAAIDFARDHFAGMEAKVKTDDNGGVSKPSGEGGVVALSAVELDMCARTGISGEEVIEHKKKAAAGDFKPGKKKPLATILLA
jgi:phage I-like protein